MPNPAVNLAKPLNAKAPLSLTLQEDVSNFQALTCTLPKDNKPSCSGAVFLGLFFDGTGNNFEEDFKKHKQSNVVRMWMAHRDKSQNGRGATTYYDKAYIPGVGTKFPEISPELIVTSADTTS
jgi:hypothetical protein